ncbi:MAG: NAD(P)H-dependent glycerol-3-phosphate dehydrogenase [Pseudomonadota bacterium]|nr:NAD(P)H-dependent glycerol-3-phosphate dehydrogenase [Pseudomonadota bacterium]
MQKLLHCKNVLVLGSGSWGTAFALHLARLNYNVSLWGHPVTDLYAMQADRLNEKYLPGIPFPDNLHVVTNLEQAVRSCDLLFCMVPSFAFVNLLNDLAGIYPNDLPFVWGSKGIIHADSNFVFLDQKVDEILGPNIQKAVVSGPTFACEVASMQPTAAVVASKDKKLATQLQLILHSDNFRIYTSSDVRGVQVCSAIKNVIAIAAGVSDGLKMGDNARSALITRGLVEMSRIGTKVGCKQDTLMGLAGMGDLILTCTSDKSRNRRLGLALGEGLDLEQAKDKIGQVVEGYHNAMTILKFAKTNNLELPITAQVCSLLNNEVSPKEAVQNLLNRAPRAEYSLI